MEQNNKYNIFLNKVKEIKTCMKFKSMPNVKPARFCTILNLKKASLSRKMKLDKTSIL